MNIFKRLFGHKPLTRQYKQKVRMIDKLNLSRRDRRFVKELIKRVDNDARYFHNAYLVAYGEEFSRDKSDMYLRMSESLLAYLYNLDK